MTGRLWGVGVTAEEVRGPWGIPLMRLFVG